MQGGGNKVKSRSILNTPDSFRWITCNNMCIDKKKLDSNQRISSELQKGKWIDKWVDINM